MWRWWKGLCSYATRYWRVFSKTFWVFHPEERKMLANNLDPLKKIVLTGNKTQILSLVWLLI